MPFFTFFRALKPRKGSTPGATFLRGVLLIAVFALAAVLYQRNFERRMDLINTRAAIYDQSGTMTQEQRDALRDFAAALKNEFGIDLRIQVRKGGLTLPEADSKTLFIGLDLDAQEAVVHLPPLLERSLDPDFVRRLRQEHFAPFFAEDNWPLGLSLALRDLWERLMGMQAAPAAPSPAPAPGNASGGGS
ncbi:MAG: TPM domain-containing protein [Thermodesulfobacteriota bacterium]